MVFHRDEHSVVHYLLLWGLSNIYWVWWHCQHACRFFSMNRLSLHETWYWPGWSYGGSEGMCFRFPKAATSTGASPCVWLDWLFPWAWFQPLISCRVQLGVSLFLIYWVADQCWGGGSERLWFIHWFIFGPFKDPKYTEEHSFWDLCIVYDGIDWPGH